MGWAVARGRQWDLALGWAILGETCVSEDMCFGAGRGMGLGRDTAGAEPDYSCVFIN